MANFRKREGKACCVILSSGCFWDDFASGIVGVRQNFPLRIGAPLLPVNATDMSLLSSPIPSICQLNFAAFPKTAKQNLLAWVLLEVYDYNDSLWFSGSTFQALLGWLVSAHGAKKLDLSPTASEIDASIHIVCNFHFRIPCINYHLLLRSITVSVSYELFRLYHKWIGYG